MEQFISSLGIFLKGAVDKTPSLRARDWNRRIVDPSTQKQLLPGVYTTVVRTQRGQVLNISPEAGWHYPWFPTVRWDAKEGFWTVRLRPGFVNGIAPTFNDIPLTDDPAIALRTFRSIPSEGDPLPPFFNLLGVRDLQNNIRIVGGGTIKVDETVRTENATPPRLLVACDVWVTIARATYRGEVTVTDASGTTGEVVDYSVRFDTSQLDRVGTAPRLQVGPKFPSVEPPTIYERLNGQFQDEGEDRLLISTLYFLSPENATDPTPNQLWQPFPSNNAFWNLSHMARNIPPKVLPAPITLFTGLAGGWGDIIANQSLANLNELSDRVFQAVNTTTNEGRFWIT